MGDDKFNVWILKSKGTESSFGGNEGYEDKVDSHYIFDTTVKNHDRIAKGDIIVITGKKYLEGFSRIERIEKLSNVSKTRYRCPVCNTQEHYERKNVSPRYKCRKKHEFDEPVREQIFVDQFTAHYAPRFIRASPNTSVKVLNDYYVRRNMYYSIQLAKSELFEEEFSFALERLGMCLIENASGGKSIEVINVNLPNYQPSALDARKSKLAKQITREGQQKFRETLFRYYGVSCMLTGCRISHVMEASHISPYRGRKDNHPANGLLLRKDLHALFDANMLGIEPTTKQVYLHPALEQSEYKEFVGKRLNPLRSDIQPSDEALTIKWEAFNKRCRDFKN